MNAQRATTLAMLGSILLADCGGGAPPAAYLEGRVDVANNVVTLNKQPLPATLSDSTLESLKRFQGLEIGVTYQGSVAEIVSPVNDEWRVFADTVDVPDDVDPRVRPTWPEGFGPRATFPDQQRLNAVAAAYRSLDGSIGAFAKGVPLDANASYDLAKLYGQLETRAYEGAAVTDDPDTRKALLNLADVSGHQMVLSYPTSRRNPPDFIARVANTKPGAVAIAKNGVLAGTGFFVSGNWLVTNRHVANTLIDPARAKVLVSDDAGVVSRECAVVNTTVADSTSPLDLAAIRFRCATAIPPAWILRLADRYSRHNEMLYIHGFFQDLKNKDWVFPVRMRYPHQVTAELRNGLRLKITSASESKLFDRFYVQCDSSPSTWCYLSSAGRWGHSGEIANIPTMGFDSNTGRGNSGSPVFSAEDHLVVGVFFAGAGNFNDEEPFSFERHEAAIPSPLVIAWLKSEKVLP